MISDHRTQYTLNPFNFAGQYQAASLAGSLLHEERQNMEHPSKRQKLDADSATRLRSEANAMNSTSEGVPSIEAANVMQAVPEASGVVSLCCHVRNFKISLPRLYLQCRQLRR